MPDGFFLWGAADEGSGWGGANLADDLDELWIAEYGADAALRPVMLRLQAAYWRRQQRIAQLAALETWKMLATALASTGSATGGVVSVEEMLSMTGLG